MSGGMILAIGAVGLFWTSLMFWSTLKLWGKLIVWSFITLKWLFIIGFFTSFLCMPQMYNYLGWTPASIVFGDDIYSKKPAITGPPKVRTISKWAKST